MPQYLHPGVYVQEVPSAVRPIAGVGTSTAGFIGVVADTDAVPLRPVTNESIGTGNKKDKVFNLSSYPVVTTGGFTVYVDGTADSTVKLSNDPTKLVSQVTFTNPPDDKTKITADYVVALARPPLATITDEAIGNATGPKTFNLAHYPVLTAPGTFTMKVGDTVTAATLANDDARQLSQVTFTSAPTGGAAIVGTYTARLSQGANNGEVKLCTNFSEFKSFFGDFSTAPGQRNLAHAVYGFFNNGGTRCFVVRVANNGAVGDALKSFEAIDEIAIVAAPGVTDTGAQNAIIAHCETTMQDRFAILDTAETVDLTAFKPGASGAPPRSDYAAVYVPWIQAFDPVNELVYVPPSGHMAGIYARVDASRGVHKAPANETVFGALDLKQPISKVQQDGLNPNGVNCIRSLNGNITVWGARTFGGDANGVYKYISTRRLFLFLRKSIDQGTQWVVFEPNDPSLWAKVNRNVGAFLTNVWRDGALFGTTPAEAFYVKCDAETNPPDVRNLGQLVTEIGVAPVQPAEFVIFRITQWGGPVGG